MRLKTKIEIENVAVRVCDDVQIIGVEKSVKSQKMHVNFENCELKIGNEKIERIGENCKTKYFKFVGIHLD